MKTQQQWFDEYAVSHQNKTNQSIHFICVPAIFFSIVGLLMSIPSNTLSNLLNINNPFIENWAAIILIILLLFYLKLSYSTFVKMLAFSIVCLMGNYFLSTFLPLFYTSLAIFVVAWIGQFYGHKLEGKKPSFFKDLQFLLIGPAWVFEKLSKKA
ncbi:putative membrane protein YGL010W [Lutibacter oceani]|uniref:Putative membrane protein YGL010W n=1 Tax=Lutibacter oceani TaxID=1853311 RepID=A0A3D9RZX0_9FLAO|nr:Mpo1-like protein [Lutibacter oceani]REE82022.1 putative membrane protein YGL010W [Lutibacter oceani]